MPRHERGLPSRGRYGIVRAAMNLRPLRTILATLASALAATLLPVHAIAQPAPAQAGAKSPEANVGKLRGSVIYREKDALPENAQVRVRLVDATPSESAPKVFAETTFPTQGKQVPIPFELPIDHAKLDAVSGYALRAYILLDGKVAYVTRGRVTVDPKAIPAALSILVVPGNEDPVVADSPAPPGAIKPPTPPRQTRQRGQPQRGQPKGGLPQAVQPQGEPPK
jgi:putative lipoprotein